MPAEATSSETMSECYRRQAILNASIQLPCAMFGDIFPTVDMGYARRQLTFGDARRVCREVHRLVRTDESMVEWFQEILQKATFATLVPEFISALQLVDFPERRRVAILIMYYCVHVSSKRYFLDSLNKSIWGKLTVVDGLERAFTASRTSTEIALDKDIFTARTVATGFLHWHNRRVQNTC